MIPHEKALVERLKNEPFALIGINTDQDKTAYRKQAEAKGVTWRSAWDGSTRGPLCTAWGVKGFPTIYVIDAKGKVQLKIAQAADWTDPKLTQYIDSLL